MRRQRLGQPLGELLEFRNVLGLGGAVLLGPAVDLTREIIAGLAEVAEADLFGNEACSLASVSILLRKIFRRASGVWLGSVGSQTIRPSSIDMT